MTIKARIAALRRIVDRRALSGTTFEEWCLARGLKPDSRESLSALGDAALDGERRWASPTEALRVLTIYLGDRYVTQEEYGR